MFATGMLIVFPASGWAVLAGVALRLLHARPRGVPAQSGPDAERQSEMEVFAGGVIAGVALTGFATGIAASLRR